LGVKEQKSAACHGPIEIRESYTNGSPDFSGGLGIRFALQTLLSALDEAGKREVAISEGV